MNKIFIVGAAGSGKSTLAQKMAAALDIPAHDLDELRWRPGWEQIPDAEFLDSVSRIMRDDRWIIEGAQPEVMGPVMRDADTMIWVDVGLTRLFAQNCRRIYDRIRNQEVYCGGNIDTWRTELMTSDSIFVWAARTWRQNRKILGPLFNNAARQEDFPHLTFIRLGSRRAIDECVRNLSPGI